MVSGYQLWYTHCTRIIPCNKSIRHACLCNTCLCSCECVHGFSVLIESTVNSLGAGLSVDPGETIPGDPALCSEKSKELLHAGCIFQSSYAGRFSDTAWRVIRFGQLITQLQLCIEYLHVSVPRRVCKENWIHSALLATTYSSCRDKCKILSPAYVYWTPILG